MFEISCLLECPHSTKADLGIRTLLILLCRQVLWVRQVVILLKENLGVHLNLILMKIKEDWHRATSSRCQKTGDLGSWSILTVKEGSSWLCVWKTRNCKKDAQSAFTDSLGISNDGQVLPGVEQMTKDVLVSASFTAGREGWDLRRGFDILLLAPYSHPVSGWHIILWSSFLSGSLTFSELGLNAHLSVSCLCGGCACESVWYLEMRQSSWGDFIFL